MILLNGHLLDPSRQLDQVGPLFLQDSQIQDASSLDTAAHSPSQDNPINLQGCLVMPGIIDLAIHLPDPSDEVQETIDSAAISARKGGITTLCCLPDTQPVNDNESSSDYFVQRTRHHPHCHFYPIGALSQQLAGQQLSEMGLMAEKGCVAFSDGYQHPQNALLMRRALEYARSLNRPIFTYPEEKQLTAGGLIHEGYYATLLGLKGMPAAAEEIMIQRDITLAKLTGARLHICAISTAAGVNALRTAKAEELPITGGTCPHYFLLDDSATADYSPQTKVRPPLRPQEDVNAIRTALADGTLDCISSDHRSCLQDEKNCEFSLAAFGIAGLETLLPLSYQLVHEGVLTPLQLVEKLTYNPAKILGLHHKGNLAPGSDADIVLFDPTHTWTINRQDFSSLGKNTPFHGKKLQGKPTATLVRGQLPDTYPSCA